MRHIQPSRSISSRISSVFSSFINALCSCDVRTFLIFAGLLFIIANLSLLFLLTDPHHTTALDKQQQNPKILQQSTQGKIQTNNNQQQHDQQVEVKVPATVLLDQSNNGIQSQQQTQQSVQIDSDAETAAKTALWSKPGVTICDKQFGNGFAQQMEMCKSK